MPVPLVLSAPASEFGDLTTSPDFSNPHVMDRDMSYVEGFSEMRRTRDIKVAEYVNHRIQKSDIPELPVNMRWARNQNKAGAPDSAKVVGHTQKGYRPVTKADLNQPWFKSIPPGAEQLADGTIRKGDTILMVATKEQAAKNAHFKAEKTQRRVTGMAHGFAATARTDGAGWKGADPSAKKESISPINVPVAQAAGK